MDELFELLLTPLAEPRRQAVRQCWQARLHDNDGDYSELDVLTEALQDYPEDYPPNWWLNPLLCRWWLCLRVDWKAVDEVEWQVQALSQTLGVNPPLFVSQVADQPGMALPALLREAAVWLRRRGYELLQVNTGGDEYLAFPVRTDLLGEVLRVAHCLALSVHLLE